MPRLRQNSIISEKSGYFINSNLNFAHVSYLTVSAKGCSGFFEFSLHLGLLKKCKKNGFCECLETRSFLVFSSNSKSKQNKKIPNISFCRLW